MYLYLAILDVAVSAILILEEKVVQFLVFYISHSMVLVEMRYLSLEKLALALLAVSCKLRPYF